MASLFEVLGGSPGSRQDSPFKGNHQPSECNNIGMSRRSRAGQESRATIFQQQQQLADENPNSMMVRETMSQAHHAEFNIAKEREYEKVQQRLYDEFSVLDVNRDGMISIDEIVGFLQSKVRYFSPDNVFRSSKRRPAPRQW